MLNYHIQEMESEYKVLLTRQEYDQLLCMLRAGAASVTEQINYYYDTPQEELRSRNITCRVRQTGDQLRGTVKRHLEESGKSIEEAFPVYQFPMYILIDQKQVFLRGQLHTHRTVIPMGKDATLMLDCNSYLGKTDYELELEYQPACREEAKGMMKLILRMLKIPDGFQNFPKSERFFRRLHQLQPLRKS